jgi:hypothetical protein
MKTRTLGILLLALVVSLPLAIAVMAHSEQPAGPQASATTTQLASLSGETAASSERDGTGIQDECVPTTCQISCPLDSCNAGPCEEGSFAKCVCRSGGHAMCGCVPCQ